MTFSEHWLWNTKKEMPGKGIMDDVHCTRSKKILGLILIAKGGHPNFQILYD